MRPFEDPHRYPSGLPYVIVNGSVVVDDGRFNARSAERVLGRASTMQ